MGIWYDSSSFDGYTEIKQYVTITETTPTHNPISLEEAKNYLKVDYATDDDLIDGLIFAARKQIENELGGLLIVKRTVTQKQSGGVKTIDIMREPLVSISSITYYEDFDSVGEVIPSTDYRIADGCIFHRNGYWKQGRDADGYRIVYTAGLVDDTGQTAENSPHTLRQAMLRIIAYLYENREEFAKQINEGGLSVNYDIGMKNAEYHALLIPYHTGKAVF